MRELETNNLNNFICGYFIENTETLDIIRTRFDECPSKNTGTVSVRGDVHVDKSIKDSMDCVLNQFPEYAPYLWDLQMCLNEYAKRYEFCNFYSPFTIIEPVNIQYYAKGGAFHTWHTERSSPNEPKSTRHLVFMTYLNDVNDGGETEFYHQQLKIKPQKGLTLIWPADWTFTHRGIPSPTEEKYIVTGWFNYIQ